MIAFLRQHCWLALFTAAYLMAAAVGCFVTGNSEFVFYLVTVCLLIAIVLAAHARIHFTPAALWGLSVWGALHMAGGLVPVPESWPHHGDQAVLYSWWLIPGMLKYDHVVHAYGFAVATVCCWQGLRAAISGISGSSRREIRPSLGMAVLAGLAGCGLGAMNEVVEFAATLLVPETNVGGYHNTALDLVANLIGSSVAAAGLWLHGGREGNRS